MSGAAPAVVPVCHVIKGETRVGSDVEYPAIAGARFATPKLDLDVLVWPRSEPGPAFDVPIAEIIDLLVATGERLRADPDGLLAEALDHMALTSPLPRRILGFSYEQLWRHFERASLEFQLREELGGAEAVDGWRAVDLPSGRRVRVRAFPPRLVHVLAGNAPGVATLSIARGALTKGVHLLKLPSNDLFTATAVLRTMAAVAPDHPVVRSFSAAYWRGGDETIESVLYRPQFFDKLVAWGGEQTIRSALRFIGPGFELVSFDPKTSISLVGREAFASEATLAEAATAAAVDVTLLDQAACASSRYQFVEGGIDEADRFADALLPELGVERPMSSAVGAPITGDLRDEIDVLRSMEPYYRVLGGYEGEGLVIRSDEPVEFHPEAKIVNVVPVAHLTDAARYANVATQTVGVYPGHRKAEVRDGLASAGVQRVVKLGDAAMVEAGVPHDGFSPLQRFVRWVNDEG